MFYKSYEEYLEDNPYVKEFVEQYKARNNNGTLKDHEAFCDHPHVETILVYNNSVLFYTFGLSFNEFTKGVLDFDNHLNIYPFCTLDYTEMEGNVFEQPNLQAVYDIYVHLCMDLVHPTRLHIRMLSYDNFLKWIKQRYDVPLVQGEEINKQLDFHDNLIKNEKRF